MVERGQRARDDLAYHGFRAFVAVWSRLPLTLGSRLTALLGTAAMAVNPRDRRRSREHLRIAFPELSEPEVRRLLRRNARHFGRLAAEIAWLWRADPQQVESLCSGTGTEHLRNALDRGNGAVLVTAHCGNWELLNAWLGVTGIPMTIAVRGIYDPRLDDMATTLRSRFGAEVVPRGSEAGRRLLTALHRNRVNGLLIDQDIRDVPGVFVPFFGRPAWTPSGAAALALRRECPVVPAFTHRRADGSHHVEVHPPLPMPEEGSQEERVEALTAAATATIERQIREHPEQWVWMHRRWRTRP
jgi:KDO2-lipid IV(A) lauroyltransferase